MPWDEDEVVGVARDAADQINAIMLALPWSERQPAMVAVLQNGIYCPHCGVGEPDAPNRNCYCMRDD